MLKGVHEGSKTRWMIPAALLLLATIIAFLAPLQPSSAAPSRLRVGVVLPGSVTDLTFSQALYEGLMQHQREGRIQSSFTENVAPADAERVLRRYAERPFDLIIAHSSLYRDGVFRVAREFPNRNFAWVTDLPLTEVNVAGYGIPHWEAAYLAGVFAAHITQRRILGWVGGVALPGCRANLHGFSTGARSIWRDIEVLSAYVGSFVDVARSKALTITQIDRGADIVGVCGSGNSLGVIEAARERGVWAIGYIHDQFALAPTSVIGSAWWDSYRTMGEIIVDYQGGRFRPGRHYAGSVKDGTMRFKVNKEIVGRVPVRAVRAVDAILDQVRRGVLVIPVSFD